ncbi:hypothetical protein NPIL_684111 [Nephila pilipes]|uniref:Uncharacterized protein n=1 Tax=Nephila pilipes TaxID=299642 RepID=A0A8X6PJZ9_NEPPI|nr:hypothetical protein NPIL_684111 [Nephila pilipes]
MCHNSLPSSGREREDINRELGGMIIGARLATESVSRTVKLMGVLKTNVSRSMEATQSGKDVICKVVDENLS